jgi:hypothetical protein
MAVPVVRLMAQTGEEAADAAPPTETEVLVEEIAATGAGIAPEPDGLSMPESFMMECHRLGDDGRNIAALVQMAGETGGMEDVLDQLASDYEEELDIMSGQIDKLIEPFILVVLGSLVAGIIYAIYGPIFGLSKVVLPKTQTPPGASAPAVPGR